jgi:hypothetical protein
MRCAIAFTFAILLCASAPARADESTPLVELCKQYLALPKPGDTVTSEYIQLKSSCAGFINSALKLSRPDDNICRPKSIGLDELATLYMAWAGKHQDRWKDPTKVTIAAALSEAFPCPSK